MTVDRKSAGLCSSWRRGPFARLVKNEDGATAIEFALVAGPFLLFVLGIIAIGLQFFTINSLDHAVETASRKLRTGEAQKAALKMSQFREMVCDAGGNFLEADCNKIVVHVQSAANWAGIVPQSCAANGNMSAQSDMDANLSDSSGGAGQVVLVTVCYDWEMPVKFPYLNHILMKPSDGVALASGGALIQSVATFRTEPYD